VNNKIRLVGFWFVALATLLGGEEPPKTETQIGQLGGGAVSAMVQSSTEVKVARLERRKFSKTELAVIRETTAKEKDLNIRWAMELGVRHPEAGQPVRLNDRQAAWIKSAILSPQNYTQPSDLRKSCEFIPIVKVSFLSPDGAVEFLFCFGCEDVMVLHNRKIIGGAEFRPARKMWAESFKVFLPDDEFIAKLR
jgi:hypothetical protein